jgi:hypothetical protein
MFSLCQAFWLDAPRTKDRPSRLAQPAALSPSANIRTSKIGGMASEGQPGDDLAAVEVADHLVGRLPQQRIRHIVAHRRTACRRS